MGKVWVVDVWPGGAQDLTLRALRALREAKLVVARDVAGVSALLRECKVSTAVRAIGQRDALPELLDALQGGDVAWASTGVTTWGTVERSLCEALLSRDVELVPIPGPTAAIVALVTSGLPADRFAFLGTLPPGPEARRALLSSVRDEAHTLVCSVPAAQLPQALRDLYAVLGDRRAAICRGQETWRGTLSLAQPEPGDGPITLVIEGAEESAAWTEEQVCREVRSMLEDGNSVRDVARRLAPLSGWPRRQVYEIALQIAGRR